MDPGQRQAAFAYFLDASWQIFRSQMLEAYTETVRMETADPLRARLKSMEQQFTRRTSLRDCHLNGNASGGGETNGEPEQNLVLPYHSKPVELLVARPVAIEEVEVVERQTSAKEVLPNSQQDSAEMSMADGDSVIFDLDANDQEEVDKERSDSATQAIRHRLQVRLGAMSSQKLITGRMLVNTVEALGLTTYTEEDMNEFVCALADYIDLRFVKKEGKNGFRRSTSSSNVFQFQDEEREQFGKPVWHWPQEGESCQVSKDSQWAKPRAPNQQPVVPLKVLSEIFVTKLKCLATSEAMKEILLAGDTNRLVAELTFVRINDLAAPPEKIHPLIFIEPFVAVLIVANGIMIGFQTDPRWEDWSGWIYLELVFAAVLIFEVAVRVYLSGCKGYFCGLDWGWNYFDLFLLVTGLTDIVVEVAVADGVDMVGASLLRFCRLVRLVRVVKVFRVKHMKELRLMVKGLVGGFRTLFLSFALLFAVLYVISGFATMTIGRDKLVAELGLIGHFENIPASMFTAFRCFSGECFAESGQPIAAVLANSHGVYFVMCYTASYMLVSLGIYNVILAVYVDITMRAAKESEAVTAEQHSRESIRIARTTRELLKKFAAAYRIFQDSDDHGPGTRLDFKKNESSFTDEDIHERIAITKELFLLIIQDQGVQFLMDELELPHDRANLFEIIDADGSGTLHVTELVQGLLKIRGEVKKSDAVATLLATKAIQNMLNELKTDDQAFQKQVLKILQPNRISLQSHQHSLSKAQSLVSRAGEQDWSQRSD
ncbi:unnamed protein product [Effrenium voratum]|nr:unnamed protein product [Effrenium voratum]